MARRHAWLFLFMNFEEDTGRHAWLDGDDFEDMFGYSMEIVSPKGMVGCNKTLFCKCRIHAFGGSQLIKCDASLYQQVFNKKTLVNKNPPKKVFENLRKGLIRTP